MEQNIIQINAGIKTNVDVSVKIHHICEKEYLLNPSTCIIENGKYLASIMNEIISDKIINEEETNFMEKNITCETQKNMF